MLTTKIENNLSEIYGRIWKNNTIPREIEEKQIANARKIQIYIDRINQINYPKEKIERLMKEGKVDDAQKLYFKYEAEKRKEVIRL